MLTVPRRIAQLTVAGRDWTGWTPFSTADPRMPLPRRTMATLVGPWQGIEGKPAHGLYFRDHDPSGLRDVAVARDGWMLWKSRGPKMAPVLAADGTRSSLISHLNPLVAQGLTFCACPPGLGWGVDPDRWKAEAVLRGLKTGAAFALRSSSRNAWMAEIQRIGTVETAMSSRWTAVYAAQRGTFASIFDLRALAENYRRVLPANISHAVSEQLRRYADASPLSALTELDEIPPSIAGLALGYPADVTAGSLLLSDAHALLSNHTAVGREEGAYCPRCDQIATP